MPLISGVASFTGTTDSLTIDKAGRRYQLQFSLLSLPGVAPAVSHSFTLGAQPVILGPTSFCPGSQATYAADPAEGSYDEYRWTLDAGPSPFAFAPSIVLQGAAHALAGIAHPRLSRRGSTAARSRPRPGPSGTASGCSTTLSIDGPTTVCVDCLGGTVKPADEGGGASVTRQWGYRTTSGAGQTVTPIVGETAGTYVVKGTDFPGPGTYYLVVTSEFTCPAASPSVSQELPDRRLGRSGHERGAVPGRDVPGVELHGRAPPPVGERNRHSRRDLHPLERSSGLAFGLRVPDRARLPGRGRPQLAPDPGRGTRTPGRTRT